MFSSNIRVIYLYLVALITIGMIIGGTIAIITTTADLLIPEKEINYTYLSGSDSKYEEQVAISERTQEQLIRDIKEVIYSVAVVVVAIPFYAYSWRKIEQERVSEKNEGQAG